MKRRITLVLVCTCLSLGLCFGVGNFIFKQRVEARGLSVPVAASVEKDVPRGVPLYDQNGDELSPEEAALRVKAMAEVWDSHRERLRHLFKDVYPGALAQKRNAPDREAVLALPNVYLPDSPARDPAAIKHKNDQYEACWREWFDLGGYHRDEMLLFGAYGMTATDETAVGRTLSIRALIQMEVSHEPALSWFRSNAAYIEREQFGNEEAARRAEACQSGEAMLTYLQRAQSRYLAASERLMEAAGFDAPSRVVILDQHRLEVANRIARGYDWINGKQAAVVLAGWEPLEFKLDVTLLADMSRDDAESRRLLTEIEDCQALLRTAETKQ